MSAPLREVRSADAEAVAAVVEAAFGEAEGEEISRLVAELAVDPSARPCLALVSVEDGEVRGHVLFTPVAIEGADRRVRAMILSPLSVHPGRQRRGIGRALVEEGFRRLESQGVELVFVFGDPAYYGRFGFAPAAARGLDAPHPIPDAYAAAWMVRTLRPETAGDIHGRVRCADVLNDPRHWALDASTA